MAFDDEQKAELEAMLQAHNKTLFEQISGYTNNAISGLAKRLISDEMPKLVTGQFSSLQALLPSEDRQRELLRNEFNALLAELAESEENPAPGTSTQSAAAESQAIAELRAQIAEYNKMTEQMKARVQAAETAAAEERKVREQIAAEQRLQGMRDDVLGQIRGKVKPNTEKQLLRLLEMDGILVEDKDNNRFMVRGKDNLGFDALLPVEQQISSLIDQQYAHFKDVRPGSGTGSAGASAPTTSGGGSYQYLQPTTQSGQVTLTDEQINAAAASGKFDELLKEVSQAAATP